MRFSNDDVLDFLVTEAVVTYDNLMRAQEAEQAEEAANRQQFRQSHREFTPTGG